MIEPSFVTVPDARLAVHQVGVGPMAVLVHGFPLDHRMWLDLLNSPLAQRRRLCAVDLRGHGLSPWTGSAEHGMETFAADLAAVITTLGDEPVDLVGLSMGGYAALALVEQRPELVRSLALVDTRAAADTPEARAARGQMIKDVVARGRRWLAEQLVERLLAPDHDLRTRAQLQTMVEATPVESVIADLAGMRSRKNRRGVLPKITVPTLVAVGEHDQLTPPDTARGMADEIPGSELVVIPDAGHMVPMEQPAALVAALERLWA